MNKAFQALSLVCAAALAGPAVAAEGTVVWYDPTCRYFVMQLPEGSEGFGLYEWKDGPEPKQGSIVTGDILGGPELTVTEAASGQTMEVVHWGDAKKQETLVRHSPDWCKSKRKRK
jgi:hypothetical protein